MTSEPLPGSDGNVLNPGGIEKVAEKTVTRQPLFAPKDEEAPPPGVNWFEHNYPIRPPAMSLRLSIDPKPLADALNPFMEVSDMKGVLRVCEGCKIKVETQPGNPIVTLRLLPS